MTKEELARFDGREGRKAYVAVNGKVFDVTASSYWPVGNHQGAHQAGKDLTADLLAAPHVRSVIERFPVVAELEEALPEKSQGRGGKAGIIIAVFAFAAVLVWMLLLR